MNEPALITRRRGTTIPDIVRHVWEGEGSTHGEAHNVYGMQMARASVEGIARLRPERRPLILTRSGWAGIQRYAMHWTGDNQSTWDHLKLSIQMVLTLGLSGVPITGPDIGGFGGGPTPELFARWIEVGSLFPFCRVHSMLGSPCSVVVLLLSTYEEDEYAPRAAESGAAAYIPKAAVGRDRLETAWAAAVAG